MPLQKWHNEVHYKFKDDISLGASVAVIMAVAVAVALIVLVTCDTLIFNRNNTRLHAGVESAQWCDMVVLTEAPG